MSWPVGSVGALIEALKRQDPNALVGIAQWKGETLGIDASWYAPDESEIDGVPKLYATEQPGTVPIVVLLTPGDLSLWNEIKGRSGT